MGQLTNLYVSESYQGLLKLANSTTGVTGTLQYVQDGIGNNIPMLVSTSSVVITGSFRGDGSGLTGITVDSGSLVTTSSFNAFTASIDGRVDALEIETGSLQNQINQKLDTGSFNSYTSSNDAKVNALINATGSYATTSSLTSLSQSIATTDLSQDGRLNSIEGVTGSFATTSSLNSYTLTSSFNSYTSSADGRLSSLESATSSLQNQINQKLDTGSFNSYTSSNDAKVNSLISQTGSYVTETESGSFVTNVVSGLTSDRIDVTKGNGSTNAIIINDVQNSFLLNNTGSGVFATTGSNVFQGNQTISGSLNVTGSINALSASITYLQTVYQTSSVIFTSGSNILGDEPSDVQTLNGRVDIPLGNLNVTGATTSSLGFFGNLQGTASFASNALSSSHSVNADTASYVLNAVSSSYSSFALSSSFAQNATSASHAINADVAISSSQAQNAVSASHSINADTAISASQAQNAISSSHSINSDNSISSSFAQNAISASQAQNAVSASQAENANLLNGTGSGVFATTGSNIFFGQETINVIDPFNVGLSINSGSGAQAQSIYFQTAEFGGNSQPTVFLNGINSYLQSNGNMFFENAPGGVGSGSINFTTNGDQVFRTNGTSKVINFVNPAGLINISGSQFDVNAINTNLSGSVNITGSSHRIIGNTTITGSLNLSGSQSITQNLRLFSSASYANLSVQPGAYITASAPVSQSNLIFASQNAPIGQAPLTNQSGSILLSGSNNILFSSNRIDTIAQGTIGYVGTNNLIFGIPTLNTGSSYRPTVNSNYLQGAVSLNLGTGSGNFSVSSNYLVGSISLNAPSASLGGSYAQNSILGNLGVQQTVPVTGSSAHSFASNVLNGALNIQINSGSFALASNVINGNGIQITGSYRSTGAAATNGFGFNNNSINGLNNRFLFDGVANGSKGFFNSLVVGANNTASLVTNDTNGISNVGLVGRGLHVESGTNSSAGGAVFVGTFNQTGSLANPGDIKFAVGTGFDNTNRRTSIWVDSFGNSNVSGSLNVIGAGTNVLNVTGGMNISSSAAYALSMTGSLRVNGNTIMSSSAASPLYVSGTITTQRLHFDGNPFNSNPSSNLGAIRMGSDNQTFQYTNYDIAQITTQSFIDQFVNTGSLVTYTRFGASYAGTSTTVQATNTNGVRNVDIKSDTTTVTGSLNVTGSVTIANAGDLTMYGHKMFNAAEFWSNTTQSGSAGVSGSLNFDASGSAVGVSLVSGSRLTVENGGTYNIQFSAQIETSAGSDTGYVWFKKNGTNIDNSATKVVLANNTAQVMTVNILDEAAANDYYELGYQFTNGNATVLAEAASGNIPAIPSVIATVTQAR